MWDSLGSNQGHLLYKSSALPLSYYPENECNYNISPLIWRHFFVKIWPQDMTTLETGGSLPDIRIHVPFSTQIEQFSADPELVEAADALDIDRLKYIRQLGIKFVDPTSPFTNPHSTRYAHTFLAAYFATEIGKNIGLGEVETRKLTTGVLLHDRKTPALGDGTKYMDPERLNEEDHWDEDLPYSSWKYISSLGLTREEIDQMIHNKGILGSILDIADRMSYVLGDLHQLNRPPLHLELGEIYKDVRLDESGQLYFKDPSRLKHFLWERAELFSRFYIDPKSQAIDLLLPSLIAPLYNPHSEDPDKLNPRKLRRLTDKDLVDLLASHYGIRPDDFYDENFWDVDYRHYETFEEALNALDRAQTDPKFKALGIKARKGFNPSTSFRGWDKLSGKPLPATELFPYTFTPYINGLVEETTGFLVVHSDASANGVARLIEGQRIF